MTRPLPFAVGTRVLDQRVSYEQEFMTGIHRWTFKNSANSLRNTTCSVQAPRALFYNSHQILKLVPDSKQA